MLFVRPQPFLDAHDLGIKEMMGCMSIEGLVAERGLGRGEKKLQKPSSPCMNAAVPRFLHEEPK